MARKSVVANRRTRQAKDLISESSISDLKQTLGGYNYKNLARKLRANPLLLNIGIGVGAYYLVKFAIRYYKDHPAIAEFISDNMDTIEEKFRDFRGTSEESTLADARH
jgi:hypothetical protein